MNAQKLHDLLYESVKDSTVYAQDEIEQHIFIAMQSVKKCPPTHSLRDLFII